MQDLTFLDVDHPVFPSQDKALENPDGLLAVGGNLQPETLISAYHQGIFPWYEDGQPLLWWSPAERAVIYPDDIKVSRSLRRTLKQTDWEVRLDSDFLSVIEHCAAPRKKGNEDTWITDEMMSSYFRLHQMGYAHSLEIWRHDKLVGGLYGVLVGAVFCGESMFSLEKDASKIALVQLAIIMKEYACGGLIDCQLSNEHLLSMGAVTISRRKFLATLADLADQPCRWPDKWRCKIPDRSV